MDTEKEIIIQEIVTAIRKLYRAVYLDATRASRRFDLTASQSGVLRILAKNGPLSSANLSRKIFVTPSNMTGIIDRLAKKDLVQRIQHPEDRRISLISLTGSGEKLSRILPDPIENRLIAGLGDLSQEEIQHLHEAMVRLLALMGGDRIPLDETNH